MTVQALSIALAAGIGLVGGSFAATAGLRIARGEGFLVGRSHCDGCGTALGFASTLPIWSYWRRSGRGACCGGAIDPLHLAGELAGGTIGALAWALFSPPVGVLLGLMGLLLIAASVVDARIGRLPDALTAPIGVGAVGLSALRGWPILVAGLVAGALAFLVLEALRRGFRRGTGNDGLGFGDVKLFTALSLWLGWSAPLALSASAMLGLGYVIIRRPRTSRIAFGPAIACGSFLVGAASLYGIGLP